MIENLGIIPWDRKVGTLAANREGHHSKTCSYFDSDYTHNGYDITPFHALVKGVAVRRGLSVYPDGEQLFGGLPSFIADSLSDHQGDTVFNEWAKVHHIRMKDLPVLGRLVYIEWRGTGALKFVLPTAEELGTLFRVKIADLYQLTRQASEEAERFNALVSGSLMIESLLKVDTSAGGWRPKAVVNVNFEEGQCYSGQVTILYPGYTSMAVRFNEHQKMSTTRIERSYYLTAVNVEPQMMPSRLPEGEQTAHLLTERPDRQDGRKVYIQMLAAMNPSMGSHKVLLETACRIGVPSEELRQLFYSMVLNVLGRNVDDHNKNFSSLMDDDGRWHATPAYDYMFSVDSDAPYYASRHSMTVNNKTEGIAAEDLLGIACRHDIKATESFIEKAIGTVSYYPECGRGADAGEEWIGTIEEKIAARIECMSDNRIDRLKQNTGFHAGEMRERVKTRMSPPRSYRL